MAAQTPFAKCMRRASMFAASGTAKVVPKQEPCRAELNAALGAFNDLTGESARRIVTRCLPGEIDLLSPAINAARSTLLKFTAATSGEVAGQPSVWGCCPLRSHTKRLGVNGHRKLLQRIGHTLTNSEIFLSPK